MQPLRRPKLLLFLLLAALFLPAFGSRGPWDPDEPRYDEVAREMRLRGDWVVPHLNGDLYAEKPPLLFWLVGLASAATREYTVSGRIVCALASVASVLATVACARRFLPGPGGKTAALGAGAVLATSVLFFHLGQQGLIDPLLTAATTVATVALLGLDEEPLRSRRAARAALGLVATAAAVLAKGPAGAIAPILSTAGAAIASRRRPRSLVLPIAPALCGAILGGALALGWLEWADARAGAGAGFFERVAHAPTASRIGHEHGPAFYLIHILWGAFPWILFVPGALAAVVRRTGTDDRPGSRDLERAAAGWFLAVLVVFTAIPSKRPGYILPLYPALALLVAARLEELARMTSGRSLDRAPAVAIGGVFVLMGPLAAALPSVSPWALRTLLPRFDVLPARAVDDIVAAMPATTYVLLPLAGASFLATGLLVIRAARRGAFREVLWVAAAGTAMASFVIHVAIYPAIDPLKCFRRVGEAIAARVPKTERLVLYPQEYDGLVGSYTGALGYEVFDMDDASIARLEGAIAKEPLWILASSDGFLPDRVLSRLQLRTTDHVGRREFYLYRSLRN